MLDVRISCCHSVNSRWHCTQQPEESWPVFYNVVLQPTQPSGQNSPTPGLSICVVDYFFPKCIVTSSLHFSKMNLILLSTCKWNFLQLVYAFIICVLVQYHLQKTFMSPGESPL